MFRIQVAKNIPGPGVVNEVCPWRPEPGPGVVGIPTAPGGAWLKLYSGSPPYMKKATVAQSLTY